MTALTNSLRRIWSAKGRVPHRTWWGTPGSRQAVAAETTRRGRVRQGLIDLVALAHRTAPPIILLALNIFR